MSNSVQLTSWGGTASKPKIHRSSSGKPFLLIVFVLIVLAGVWFFIPRRHTAEMESFIPASHSIEVYVYDPATKRNELLKSPLLQAIPEDTAAAAYLHLLTRKSPIPDWLLNNISSGLFHISVEDSNRPDSLLVITRMTRIGLLSEKFFSLSGNVSRERAGGLDLKKVKNAEIFYSVRNKYLLVSPSRDALIQALTLPPEEAIEKSKFEAAQQKAREADLFCRLDGKAFLQVPTLLKDLSFSVRLNQSVPRLSITGSFSNEMLTKYGTLLPQNINDDSLDTPLDGIASLSVNLGAPLPQWYAKLAETNEGWEKVSSWITLSESLPENASATELLQYLIASFFHSSGEKIRLAWFGFDPLEVVPAPLFAGTVQGKTDALHAAFDLVPPAPFSDDMIILNPSVDSELLLATVPFIGGENLTPSLAIYPQGALFASSETLIRKLMQSDILTAQLGQKANLYFHLHPAQAWEAAAPALDEFAAAGLLRGYTESSFAEAAAKISKQISTLQEFTVLGIVSDKAFHLEAKVTIGLSDQADNNAIQIAQRGQR